MTVTVGTSQLRIVSARGEPVADLDDLQGLWTVAQYLRITDRHNLPLEFTDGMLEVLPMPTDRHQAIQQFLLFALASFLHPRGGRVYSPVLRLRIRPDKFREPDLLLLRDANDARRQEAYWLGADLVLEVVSPDDPERDLVVKRADYAEGGIPEYWIVNPQDESITVLRLAGAQYLEHGIFRRGDTATSPLLPGFAVAVSEVFDAR